MTTSQRVFFFKVVNQAYKVSGDGTQCEAWRKRQMVIAIPGCDSVSRVTSQEQFETLMLHFATLSNDFELASKFSVAQETRLRFILGAVEADLTFLRERGCNDAWMTGIYHQMGHPDYNTIDDIPSDSLRLLVQIADSYVRKLRRAAGLDPSDLPSAGPPWCIRGVRAAQESAVIRATATMAPSKAG